MHNSIISCARQQKSAVVLMAPHLGVRIATYSDAIATCEVRNERSIPTNPIR